MNEKQKIQLIGRELKRDFRKFFLFYFKYIEKIDFKVEDIHINILETIKSIYNGDIKRLIINCPPRSSKTTAMIYFIAYCLANNPKCQFIYTSFNQDLLNDNSRRLGIILKSDLYREMFLKNVEEQEIISEFENDFWRDYYHYENKEFKISSRKITTEQGGIILFNSMGSTITGFGFSVKGCKEFSGSLIIDDGNKPMETERYKKTREKVFEYYKQTLLTRANTSEAPIINIQQRLHIEDLSGLLLKNYNFDLLKIPLIKDGVNQLPSQYNNDRIKELMSDNYLWNSQYQQEPIIKGGSVIKTEWFKNYDILPKLKKVYIVGDTAFKTNTSADYSVFGLIGKDNLGWNSNYYLIDMIRGKWESPELLNNLLNFIEKWRKQYLISCLYIEDKASGIGLIQQIRRLKIPVQPINYNQKKDKYLRLSDVLPLIQSGYYYLPTIASWKSDFIKECEEFRADLSHEHDDIIDSCLSIALSQEVNKNSSFNWIY